MQERAEATPKGAEPIGCEVVGAAHFGAGQTVQSWGERITRAEAERDRLHGELLEAEETRDRMIVANAELGAQLVERRLFEELAPPGRERGITRLRSEAALLRAQALQKRAEDPAAARALDEEAVLIEDAAKAVASPREPVSRYEGGPATYFVERGSHLAGVDLEPGQYTAQQIVDAVNARSRDWSAQVVTSEGTIPAVVLHLRELAFTSFIEFAGARRRREREAWGTEPIDSAESMAMSCLRRVRLEDGRDQIAFGELVLRTFRRREESDVFARAMLDGLAAMVRKDREHFTAVRMPWSVSNYLFSTAARLRVLRFELHHIVERRDAMQREVERLTLTQHFADRGVLTAEVATLSYMIATFQRRIAELRADFGLEEHEPDPSVMAVWPPATREPRTWKQVTYGFWLGGRLGKDLALSVGDMALDGAKILLEGAFDRLVNEMT